MNWFEKARDKLVLMEFGNEHDTTRQTDFSTSSSHALARYDVIITSVRLNSFIV